MKVLQIDKYPYIKGGTETVMFNTIRLLNNAGHQVSLFATDEGQSVYQPTYTTPYFSTDAPIGEKIKRIGSFFYNRRAAKELERVIQTEKPDIAHIHLYLNSLSVSILPVLKKYGIPVVMSLHDYRQICPSYLLLDRNLNICEKCKSGNYFHCMFSRCSKGSVAESTLMTFEMYFRRWFYKTEKYVDRFICVSRFEADKHAEFNKEIARKIKPVYNPVAFPSIYKTMNRGNYILYAGRLSREKGLPTLLSVMKRFPDIQLKVAGAGEKRYSESALPNVEFLGHQNKSDLEDLIYNASYVIVPSEWYETFGLACTESLALGTPVIASRIGAIPEIVEDGQNGYLFEPKNEQDLATTLQKALQISNEEYERLSKNGYESVKKFSEEIYFRNLMEVYNELVK
ncbi:MULTISPECIES: glycosyltransferase family 4 protein [unclassified Dysgonomonas]|uniref:glycosyltransferase family 4 protein n=1 Tax=unclassified Dysgonomonas TaxID=2630389 RepID=UPI0024738BF7|nr:MULTISPECIES: glycosyltransferase family 4 protein [unclassified Dysgonomonas]